MNGIPTYDEYTKICASQLEEMKATDMISILCDNNYYELYIKDSSKIDEIIKNQEKIFKILYDIFTFIFGLYIITKIYNYFSNRNKK